MKTDEEKFGKDYEVKGLSDDNYPYSLQGLKAFDRVIRFFITTLMYWVIGILLGALLKVGMVYLDGKIQEGMSGLSSSGGTGLVKVSGLVSDAVGTSPEGWIKFDVLMSISKWSSVIFTFVGEVLVVLTIIMALIYAYYIVRRHLCWETNILINDIRSMRLKKKYLKQINAEKVYNELKKRIKKERNGEDFERSSKNDVELARVKAHKSMYIFVNTRKAQYSPELQRQYRAVFEVPLLQEAVTKLESDLKNVDIALRKLLKGKVTFGKTETSEDFGYKVSRGLVVEEKQLEIRRNKVNKQVLGESLTTKPDDSWSNIPLSVYMDKTQEIEAKKKVAGERSEKMAQRLSTYFVSVQSNLTLSNILLNAKNAIYHFDLPKYNPQMPEATTLERNLQAMFGESSLTVEVSAGVDITIPLPKEAQLPLDTATVFRKAFGDGKAKPTDVIAGVKANGEPLVIDFATFPHLLIAGASGGGKSVAINAMIHSIFLKATPDQIRMAMIDPKFVEFEPYKESPYLFTPIINRMENAFAFLTYLADVEMDRRYAIFEKFSGVKDMAGFNDLIDGAKVANEVFKRKNIKSFSDYENSEDTEVKGVSLSVAKVTLEQPEILETEKMPYLLTIVDEYADMAMMIAKHGSKIKDAMTDNFKRLGQKARAAGIHVWLATQRPSVQVISGDIKTNFLSRYALRVPSSVDSDVVLDSFGAENLLGRGDGLVKDDSGKIVRTQALFIDDKAGDSELTKALMLYKKKFGKPVYVNYLQEMVDKGIVEWVKNEDGSVSTTDVDIVSNKSSIFG